MHKLIYEYLQPLNLPKHEILFLHVRLKKLLKEHFSAELQHPVNYQQLAKALIDVLHDMYAPRGILIPAFTYSFTKTGLYDRTQTPSEIGRFSEEIRKVFPSSARTMNPVFSVIDCDGILEPWNIDESSAFGNNSLWDKLGETGHICVNLNLPEPIMSTYLHCLEARHAVPYRYAKMFPGRVSADGQNWQSISFQYYVRDINRDTHWRRAKIAQYLLSNDALCSPSQAPAAPRWFHSKDLDALLGAALEKDPEFFITDTSAPRAANKDATKAAQNANHDEHEASQKLASIGEQMYAWAKDLFPITRSITGPGVRQTLRYLRNLLPDLRIHAVASGTRAFDWTVPDEWTIRDAYITDIQGNRVVDFQNHNLHIVGYSEPVNLWLSKDALDKHLYSLPEQADAIPYITSYYKRRWGFCLTHKQRMSMLNGQYHVVIDADLKPGKLNYGELLIPATENSDAEVLLSTYICHPSMANNELSGPVVTTALAQWLMALPKRRYNYRIVFIPETIGSLVYLSRNMQHLKKHVVAGFNISCVGDDRTYSYLPSRNGTTISDTLAKHVLKWISPNFKSYAWADRGSDERQYCAPGIDLPIASIMRTKYGQYSEYHTSLDDLERVVAPSGLAGGYFALQRALEALEMNWYPVVTVLGEPQLGSRGLYPTLSTKTRSKEIRLMMNFITWCDGKHALLAIAERCNVPIWELYPLMNKLAKHDLLRLHNVPIAHMPGSSEV